MISPSKRRDFYTWKDNILVYSIYNSLCDSNSYDFLKGQSRGCWFWHDKALVRYGVLLGRGVLPPFQENINKQMQLPANIENIT